MSRAAQLLAYWTAFAVIGATLGWLSAPHCYTVAVNGQTVQNDCYWRWQDGYGTTKLRVPVIEVP